MTRRWPPIVLIVALLVGAVVIGSGDDGDTGSSEAVVDPTSLLPVAAPSDALDSTWFCAGQGAGDEVVADGTIVVANVGDTDASGRLSVVAEGTDQDPVTEDLDVPARTTRRIRLADLLEADWVAATVEVDAGDVVVEHEVVGEHGRDVAPCQDRAASRWSFPSGASTRDAAMTLAIYNPFPGPATVDLTFATDDGTRDPDDFQSMPVPPRSLKVVDVSSVVTERSVIATSLTTRRGQVVADRIQVYDGEGAATTAEEEEAEGYYERRGLTVSPGVPEAGLVWRFPAGLTSDFVREQVVVANATEDLAEVELGFALEEPERNGVLDPFPMSVGPGEVAVFDVDAIDVIPSAVAHAIEVRSENGVPVTVERLLSAVGDSPYLGTAASTGSPVAAPRWAFAAGPDPAVESGRIALVNPGDEDVTVELAAFGDGESSPLLATPPGSDVEPGPERLTLPAGGRYEVTLAELPEGRSSVLVSATGPIVAERRLVAVPSAPADAADGDDEDDDDDEDEVGLGASTTIGIPLAAGLVVLE